MAAPLKQLKKLILKGFVPIEELERGFPRIRKKGAEHVIVLVRSSPEKLYRYSAQPIKVKITIEGVFE